MIAEGNPREYITVDLTESTVWWFQAQQYWLIRLYAEHKRNSGQGWMLVPERQIESGGTLQLMAKYEQL